MTPAAPRRRIWMAVAAAAVFLLDRLTKTWATNALPGRPPIRLLGGIVEIVLSENAGGFLSLGGGLAPALRYLLFVVLVGIGLVIAAVWLVRARSLSVERSVAAAAIVAGGVSNLLDRSLRGGVVDFAILRAGPLHTGIFNVADAAILCGSIAFVWLGLRGPARRISEG